jgi:hypothetical protein
VTPGSAALQKTCEEFADADATAAGAREAQVPFTRALVGTVAQPEALILSQGAVLLLPFFVVVPVAAVELTIHAVRDQRARREVRQDALRACLEPTVLATSLGRDHPEVTRSLDRLAARRAALGHRQAEARERERERQASQIPTLCDPREVVAGGWVGGLRSRAGSC